MGRLATIWVAGIFLLAACGGGNESNSSCETETDAAFCERAAVDGKVCGQIVAPDNCGETRTVDCGTAACVTGTFCNDSNECECATESDETFCARLAGQGKVCGSITAADNCNVSRTVDCGTAACVSGTVCSSANTCVCAPDSDAEFCAFQAGQGKVCGSITAADNCGASRTVDCGTAACSSGTICSDSNACVCAPESDEVFCAFQAGQGRVCGSITATDNCGASRTVDCGTGACVGGTVCAGSNTCECASDSTAAFCARQALDGKVCGSIAGTDLCGRPWTVNCGTTACTGGMVCNSENACVCSPESKAAFCARQAGLGKVCGSITAADNCGTTRTEDCGTTACGSGMVCDSSNACVCAPESDSAFCGRQAGLGKVCGSITANDNCGTSRTVDCGTLACTGGSVCDASNVCACTSDSEAAFCIRQAGIGKECGSITGNDLCGRPWTVDCGTAACIGGTVCSANNVCGCVGEDNATFCARQAGLGKVCGSITALDNCGTSKTVNCGTSACTGSMPACDGATNQCIASNCSVAQDYGTVTPLASSYGEEDYWYGYVYGEFPINTDTDYVIVELYEGYGAFSYWLQTGTFQISGDELNYATCGLCMLMMDEDDNLYFATGGTVTLTSVSGYLTGTLTNATFEEVTISGGGTSTPVPGGCQTRIGSMTFSTYLYPLY